MVLSEKKGDVSLFRRAKSVVPLEPLTSDGGTSV